MGFGFLNLVALKALMDELTNLSLSWFRGKITRKNKVLESLTKIESTRFKIILWAHNAKRKEVMERRKTGHKRWQKLWLVHVRSSQLANHKLHGSSNVGVSMQGICYARTQSNRINIEQTHILKRTSTNYLHRKSTSNKPTWGIEI